MYCMNCGEDIPANVRFCSACGAPADTEATRIASRNVAEARVRTSFDTGMKAIEPSPQPGDMRAPQTPRSPHEAEETERIIFSIRPTFLFIGLGYAAAALAAIGLSILLGVFAGQFFSASLAVLVTLPLLLIPAYKHLRRNAIKYTLTDSKIEIDQGLVARRTRNIPIRNIQDVTVSATIPQRLLGFGDLIIDNASELGGSTHLRNIPDPRRHAELLLRELRRWN